MTSSATDPRPLDFLFERFASAPDRVALIDDERRLTYGEALQRVGAFTETLRAAGVKSGEVAITVGDYSPDVFCLLLALLQLGVTVVPVTPQSVVETVLARSLSEAQWEIDLDATGAVRVAATGVHPTAPMLVDFLASRRPGLILFSSGSTGKPKAILHDFARVAEKFEKPAPPIVAIAFLMLDHFGGINTLLAITSGLGTVVTVSNRSVPSICQAIARHRVEVLPTTPSFLNLLVRSDLLQRFDLSSLRRITYGTEVMPQGTLERLHEQFPEVVLQQTYGLSELGVLRSKSRDDGSLWVRVGGEGFETKVVDEILWIRSRYAMVGYLNAPSPFDAEGWFNTQDRVEVDGDYFRILGRVTDLINVAGQKVYPAEIEEVILALENVADVAVYSEKNNLLGHIIVAAIQTHTPEPVAELKARVRKACAAKLSAFKVPTKVVIATDNLYSTRLKKVRSPQSASGEPS